MVQISASTNQSNATFPALPAPITSSSPPGSSHALRISSLEILWPQRHLFQNRLQNLCKIRVIITEVVVGTDADNRIKITFCKRKMQCIQLERNRQKLESMNSFPFPRSSKNFECVLDCLTPQFFEGNNGIFESERISGVMCKRSPKGKAGQITRYICAIPRQVNRAFMVIPNAGNLPRVSCVFLCNRKGVYELTSKVNYLQKYVVLIYILNLIILQKNL